MFILICIDSTLTNLLIHIIKVCGGVQYTDLRYQEKGPTIEPWGTPNRLPGLFGCAHNPDNTVRFGKCIVFKFIQYTDKSFNLLKCEDVYNDAAAGTRSAGCPKRTGFCLVPPRGLQGPRGRLLLYIV